MLAITTAAAAPEMAPTTQERYRFLAQMFSTLIVTMMAGSVSDLSQHIKSGSLFYALDKIPTFELKCLRQFCCGQKAPPKLEGLFAVSCLVVDPSGVEPDTTR